MRQLLIFLSVPLLCGTASAQGFDYCGAKPGDWAGKALCAEQRSREQYEREKRAREEAVRSPNPVPRPPADPEAQRLELEARMARERSRAEEAARQEALASERAAWSREFLRADLLPSERNLKLLNVVSDQLAAAGRTAVGQQAYVPWIQGVQAWEEAEEARFIALYAPSAPSQAQSAKELADRALGKLQLSGRSGDQSAVKLIVEIVKKYPDDLGAKALEEARAVARASLQPGFIALNPAAYDLAGRRQAIEALVRERKTPSAAWLAYEQVHPEWREFVRHRGSRTHCREVGAAAVAPDARSKAERGDVPAMVALASTDLCLMRYGVESSLYRTPAQERVPTAARWLDKAAQRGHARSACELAVLHDFDLPGLRAQYPKAGAGEWLPRAAAAGDACAVLLQASRAAKAGRTNEAIAAATRLLARPAKAEDEAYRLLADDIVRPPAKSLPNTSDLRGSDIVRSEASDWAGSQGYVARADRLKSAPERLVEIESLLMDATFSDPRNGRAWASLGDVRRRLGDTKRAIAAYRNAVAWDPERAFLYWAQLGRFYAGMDANAEAAEAFLVSAKMDHKPSLHGAALALAKLARREEALSAWEQLLLQENLPEDKAEYDAFRQTLVLAELGPREKAIAAWEKLLRLNRPPGDLAEYNALRQTIGLAPLSPEQLRDQVDARLAVLPGPEASRQLLVLAGRVVSSAERQAKLRQAIAADPSNVEAQVTLASELWHSQNSPRDAEPYVRAAARLEPKSAHRQYQVGRVLMAQERYAEAAAAYREALVLDPKHYNTLIDLGVVLGEAGDYDGAVDAFGTARQLRPMDSGPYEGLGKYLRRAARHEEALAAYEGVRARITRSSLVSEQIEELRAIVAAKGRSQPARP
jgi:tetratricopeptide (TPR) repeat protein